MYLLSYEVSVSLYLRQQVGLSAGCDVSVVQALGSALIAFGTALLFASHPVHVEVINPQLAPQSRYRVMQ